MALGLRFCMRKSQSEFSIFVLTLGKKTGYGGIGLGEIRLDSVIV